PLAEGWSARIGGEWSRSDSETDGVYFKRLAVFPSLAWSPDAGTRVVLRLRHVDNRTLDYAGLPVDGTLDTSTFTLQRSFNLSATGLPETTQSSDGANLQWTQRLDERWSFGLTAAWNRVKMDERGVFPVPFGGGGPVQALFGARLWNDWRTTTLSPALTGKLDWAGMRHTLSLGLDHERSTDDAYMAFSVGPGFFGDLGMVDLTHPVLPAWVEPLAPNPPDQRNRYTASVAYVQDQVDIGRWHLLGGLRYSRISVTDVNSSPMFGQNNVSKNSKATPRVGAVFDISPAVSVFAGYSEGIKVPTGSLFATPPKPETSVQKEIGLRLKDLAGVSATLAVFDLRRRNAPVTDPTTFLSVQTGEQRAKGVDLDLRWQATPALTLLAAYTAQTARVTEHAFDPTLVDKRLFNVPERQGRLAARYEFRQGDLAGLGLGLGVTSRGRLPIDNANSAYAPAATVWDAQLSYRHGIGRYGLSVQNLLDKAYWQPAAYFGGGQVLPALPRSVSASAQFSF
ncbi:MAG: TonB-dependent receptor, partial [Burkholderiales bacterium]|nr:TonB-dependent receptor [Burkholderiales bacterium]